jgi:hypothetical protein
LLRFQKIDWAAITGGGGSLAISSSNVGYWR